jgi:hypothetical protein
MKIDPQSKAHLLFFFIFLPALSVGLAHLCSSMVQTLTTNYPTSWYFALDTFGVLGAYGFLYKLYDLYLWKYLPWKSFSVVDFPIIEGRWKGQILSSYDDHRLPTEAVLEVKQTFSEVKVCMYTKKSHSYSLVEGFVKEETGQTSLHFEYLNVPNGQATKTMNPHFGTGILVLHSNTNRIEGEYYNSPRFSRGHAGRYEFEFLQKKLLHHL